VSLPGIALTLALAATSLLVDFRVSVGDTHDIRSRLVAQSAFGSPFVIRESSHNTLNLP
jgi:hypothetical protein